MESYSFYLFLYLLNGIYLIFNIHSSILSVEKSFIKSQIGLCLFSKLQKGLKYFTYYLLTGNIHLCEYLTT